MFLQYIFSSLRRNKTLIMTLKYTDFLLKLFKYLIVLFMVIYIIFIIILYNIIITLTFFFLYIYIIFEQNKSNSGNYGYYQKGKISTYTFSG